MDDVLRQLCSGPAGLCCASPIRCSFTLSHLFTTMQNGPDRKKQRKGKRPRSPSQPDLPFTLRELETLKVAMQQHHYDARAAAQPFFEEGVAFRKQAWKARWTSIQKGIIVSSADITELKLKKSAQRITKHEEDYLQILRNQRE